MANKAVYLRVGLLLVAGVVAAVGLVLFLGQNTVNNGARFETYFAESVQGLDVGGQVKYRGVTLGEVTEIGLVSAAYPNAPDIGNYAGRLVFVRYVIDPRRLGTMPDMETAIREGLRIRLASQGITGLAYLEIDFVNPRRFPVQTVPWTPKYSYLPSMPSTITQVQDAAQTVLAQLQNVDLVRLAAGVQSVLDDLHNQLSTGEVKQALGQLVAVLTATHAAVDASDLPATTASVRALANSVRNVADGKQTKEMLTSLARATDRLPALIASLEAVTRRANDGTADLQADLLPTLRDARAAVANLRDTTEALRRYPSSVLLGGPPPRDPGR